ncbi:hypothetical protein EC957_003986 [Mortierella hygrophila]|uniref:Uncharacterized protein n=1 Tax=Mortierella hygrophila TaxID=979708 RepID=A0A9P6F146_9FUNG|nr:hypothetical protein EC957_003986 [Mortierella hygrophila]
MPKTLAETPAKNRELRIRIVLRLVAKSDMEMRVKIKRQRTILKEEGEEDGEDDDADAEDDANAEDDETKGLVGPFIAPSNNLCPARAQSLGNSGWIYELGKAQIFAN